jgi:aminoglycoside phosphotransferase (APT) family kinase protein
LNARSTSPPFDLAAIEHLAAQILSPHDALTVERVAEGVSTYVYRICRDTERFYLRVLPEEGASFAPEVFVHTTLRARGVRLPEVIAFEHDHPTLHRSVMVTTAIAGLPINHDADTKAPRHVLHDAGRDLAIINTLPVAGFGWIRRDRPAVTALAAEMHTNRAFLLQDLDAHLGTLHDKGIISRTRIEAIQMIITRFDYYFDVQQAYLAHGDFDATHIYQSDGLYSGLIDFGEIRGTDPFYDLGHCYMENRALLHDLLDGYGEVVPLPPDIWWRIHFASLFIRIRRAVREMDMRPEGVPRSVTLACIAENIDALHT